MTQKKPAHINSYQVEVKLRPDFTDAEGASALALLNGLGLNSIDEVRSSLLYEIRGPLNSGHVQQAARELLCDAVTQEFRLTNGAPAILNGRNHWRIEVWPKSSVADPVGESAREAIAEMGLPLPETVRAGRAYRVAGRCSKVQLEKAVLRSLANPVIHRVNISEAHP